MDEAVVAALALIERADADPLEVTAACEVLVGFAHARQLGAIREVAEQQPAVFDPCGQLVDPVPAEIACALGWSTGAAISRMDLAEDLGRSLPGVLEALGCGRVDLAKAHVISSRTCELDPCDRIPLADRAVVYAGTHTRAQLLAWLDRQVASIDADAVRRRRRAELGSRRVWIQPQPHGMATLGAYLSAEEAQACWEALRGAAANIEGNADAARADALIALLTGTAVGTPVPVQVIHTPAGPDLAGHGPISRAHAQYLCRDAEHITLTPAAVSIGYQPSASIRRRVQARDRHCRFPGCPRPAVGCDLDHLLPYPAGPTSETNLHCLCRYHHRLKTHTDWKVRQLPGHTLEWTSPRGRVYLTSPDDP